jgi:cell division septal protein FtsQ
MRDLHRKKPRPAVKNRLKKQRKPINWRGFLKKGVRVVGGFVAVSIVAVIAYDLYGVLARTTFLRLERIEVGPLKKLTRDEVIAISGVKPGNDMFSLRLKKIGGELAKNPWVQKVTVRRCFPHTLAIELTERDPVAVVNMGYLYYLDTKGEVFKPLTEGDRLDFPVVTGITEEDMAKDPNGTREAFQGVLRLLAALQAGKDFGLKDVSEIHYGKGSGFTLFTASGGVPMRIGSGAFDAKLARLSRVYRELQAQLTTMQYIDLDYNDKIIVKKA